MNEGEKKKGAVADAVKLFFDYCDGESGSKDAGAYQPKSDRTVKPEMMKRLED